jgi:hypothetical protein
VNRHVALVRRLTYRRCIGALVYAACRACGHVELYARDVASISTDDARLSVLESEPNTVAPPTGPYR